jgi:superfamily I DNA/RNA helicase
LRFAYNPKDYLSFGRIINVPRRGIGEVNLNKIITANAKEDIDMLETIKKIGAGTSSVSFTPQIRSKLKELSVIVDEASEMIKNKVNILQTSIRFFFFFFFLLISTIGRCIRYYSFHRHSYQIRRLFERTLFRRPCG